MTRPFLLAHAMAPTLAAATLALALPACGNYSNEDLEYMSAIPQRDDVAIEVPRRGMLVAATAAEGWRTTLDVTRSLNRVADAFLSLVEKIRTYSPTKRLPDERVWGPYPAEDHPGWQIEFHMQRIEDGGGATTGFEYALVMIPPAGVTLAMGGPSTQIIGGSFDASGGVRVGQGQLTVTLAEGRAAGLEFGGLERLVTLGIDYRTRVWPRMVTMQIENLPSDTDLVRADYVYEREENGDGAMTFAVPKNLVEGPLGEEILAIKSRWLGTGSGRADTSVTGGDVPVGATAVECWGDDYRSSYKFQSWIPEPKATGDAASCISTL